mmetsp:Transcript_15515/g.35342  ORF Transcript_15515/g.35342 Transcript_15515/m.35342 type:complete len:249 (+) Transcript_15515:40-786(+)
MLEPPKHDVSEGPEVSLLKRVGLSVLRTNDSFWQQSREEALHAEESLEALRREAQLRQARCQGQLDSLARDAREEQERRLISEKVGKELAALREEMQRKEAAEEERLRHLYRGILGPSGGLDRAELGSGAGSSSRQRDSRLDFDLQLGEKPKGFSSPSFMPLIVSEASLLDSEPSWDAGAVPLKGDLDMLSGKDFWPVTAAPLPDGGGIGSRGQLRGKVAGKSKDMRDANKLLQVNIARLERLERCGL